MEKIVGLGYHLRAHQLDYVAELGGKIDLQTIYTKLDYYLQNDISGPTSRKKVSTILLRIWHLVPNELVHLRDDALEIFRTATAQEKIALHWGMILLAYPFFRDMNTELGNLFTQQHDVPAAQMYRKMRNLYGDKERVNVATKSVFATLRFMNCIQTSRKSVYIPPTKTEITNKNLKNWMAEVVIRASERNAMPIDIIESVSFLYPFRLRLNVNEIGNKHLYVIRQGLNMNMVCTS